MNCNLILREYLTMSVTNIKTTVEAVVEPYIVALELKYKSMLARTMELLESYQQQIQAMTSANATMQSTVDELTNRVDAMATTVARCNTAVEEAGIIDLAETNNAIIEIRTGLTNATAAIQNNTNTLTTLSTNVQAQANTISTLQGDVGTVRDRVSSVVSDTTAQLNSFGSTVTTLTNNVSSLSTNVTSLGNTVSENNTALNTKIENVKGDMIDIRNNITTVNNSVQTLSNTVAANKTTTDEAIMHLQEQIDSL